MITREQFLDPLFQFVTDSHTYYYNHKRLTSVTTLLKTFTPPFERNKIAAKIAAREGRPMADVLGGWEVTASVSRAVGTETHSFAEWVINNLHTDYSNPATWPRTTCPYEIDGYRASLLAFFHDNPRYVRNVIPEVRLCHQDSGIAGTADLLGDTGSSIFLADYKAGKPIEFVSSRHMKPPIADLYDATGNHYALQLTLYAYMAKTQYGLTVDELLLVWLDGHGGYKIYPIAPFTLHLEDILHWATRRKAQ